MTSHGKTLKREQDSSMCMKYTQKTKYGGSLGR